MDSEIRLFVGNLPQNTNEQELQQVFSGYGNVTNLDLKSKSENEANHKKFAFVTLSTSENNIESCIRDFAQLDFKGNKLYVTRARESFLERLQRERIQAQTNATKNEQLESPKKNQDIKVNPRKRKFDNHVAEIQVKKVNKKVGGNKNHKLDIPPDESPKVRFEFCHKKLDSEKRRMESMNKKRQEFKEKQKIIKTGLTSIDNAQNTKIVFDDDNYEPKSILVNKNVSKNIEHNKGFAKKVAKKKSLFNEDDDDSDKELNFEIKKHYEGKKGQKVLDLQSRYKSDKRFVLDERFIDEASEDEKEKEQEESIDEIELGPENEKAKQLNILQDVLGVSFKMNLDSNSDKKTKSRLGMFRFDPSQPEHSKYLATVQEKEDTVKKTKKNKKMKKEEVEIETQKPEPPKIEVSKEQFYAVSETLKETIAQPSNFSLRSLFGNNNQDPEKDVIEHNTDYIPLEMPKEKKKKVKNPLEPGEKNPFVYDSSESETEEVQEDKKETVPEITEVKAVWKENLFFSNSDHRLSEGLAFFSKTSNNNCQKERRELKSLMKKRIYNKERKNQMFQKKIGGRKKMMKKSYNRRKQAN